MPSDKIRHLSPFLCQSLSPSRFFFRIRRSQMITQINLKKKGARPSLISAIVADAQMSAGAVLDDALKIAMLVNHQVEHLDQMQQRLKEIRRIEEMIKSLDDQCQEHKIKEQPWSGVASPLARIQPVERDLTIFIRDE